MAKGSFGPFAGIVGDAQGKVEVAGVLGVSSAFTQGPFHRCDVAVRDARRVDIRKAPPAAAEARIDLQRTAIGLDGFALAAAEPQTVPVNQPVFRGGLGKLDDALPDPCSSGVVAEIGFDPRS